ncbi:MAG TPA: LamG-like jellyroll fold domain-containing protein, partial [Sedimentisphaerales bacterium]|nr:LamG-like jellyroll fold domain-containing protein [Sedimentisphaerales bacterium]
AGESYVETNAWITEMGIADFSISAWIQTREQGAAILGKSNGDRSWSFHEKQFYLSAGTEQGQPVAGGVHFYGNQAGEIWGATAVNNGIWHHVCVTWDNDTDAQHIYVDGVLDDLRPVWVYYGGRGDIATDTVRIGFDCSGDATSDFIGRMDDVAIFDATLTPEQVVEVMRLSLPVIASNPIPDNGTTDLPRRDVVLTWNPGVYANRHDVYFGTTFNDVNNASRTNRRNVLLSENQVQNYYPASGGLDLDFGTTYYWRIDEVNAPPTNTIYKGETWQFTTEPIAYPIPGQKIAVTASSQAENQGPENTINGSGLTGELHSDALTAMWLTASGAAGPAWIEYEFDKVYKLAEMRVWNHNGKLELAIGFGCKNVSVEYSLDGTDYTALGTTHEFARAPGKPGYACNTLVGFGGVTAKYVRLTINSNWGGILKQYGLSEVRFFSVPVFAREPSPVSGATNVDVDMTLSWRPGREAARHDVYLSTDEQAVMDGIAPVSTVTEASYSPGPLDVDGTYYWRIDEVNDVQTPATWRSDIWSFTTIDSIVVDGFEFYNDLNPDLPGSNRIFDKWLDGYGTATNGAIVGHDDPPYAEQDIVYSGFQSMPYFYNNNFKFSEAQLPLSPAQNWTRHGVTSLVLYFYGDPANAVEQMYVKVNDFKVVYGGAPLNITTAEWNQWSIDLALLSVNLQNVTKIAIGFGDGTATKAGGSGVVYFDNIGLYRSAPSP